MSEQGENTGLLGAVGHTPLVRLSRLVPTGGAVVYAKLEFMNPSGSVKDRLAAGAILDARIRGLLKPGGTIVEATSGNSGLALAAVGASLGYKVLIVMPADAPEETRRRVQLLGGEVVSSPPAQGMAGATAIAQRLAKEHQGYWVNQFANAAGVRAHEEGTGREILAAIAGRGVDAFVAGVGTGATLMGVATALRRRYPEVQIIAVEPFRSPILSKGETGTHRIAGLGPSFVPPLFKREDVSRIIAVTDEQAMETAARLGKEEGLLVGPSSGANVGAALQVAKELGADKVVVTVLPDSGDRYLRG